MKKIVLAAAILWSAGLQAQSRSINFSTVSLAEAFKLAKAQHKMIFTDCYTVWCGPCKNMDKYVFTQDSVADFFNSHFINVKMDMEKGEGPEAMKKYAIGAYPTYLLFDENGNQVYKFVGGMSATEFMAKIRVGINPENDIVIREKRYLAGDRDFELMRGLTKQRFGQKDPDGGILFANEYFDMLKPQERLKPENWFLFGEGYDSRYMSPIGSRNFNYLMENYQAFVAQNGRKVVDDKINAVFLQLAKYALEGYYFKKHAFDKAEFEGFTNQIKKSQFPDKQELLLLVDIGRFVGQKNSKAIGKLLAGNVSKFSPPAQTLVSSYITYCMANDKSYPYLNEISEKLKKSSSNEILINFVKNYGARIDAKKGNKK